MPFSIVMATGIVGIAALLQAHESIAEGLLALGAVVLLVCWAMFAARLVRRPSGVVADLQDHAVAPAFFTAVAGTAVIGSGSEALGLAPAPAVLFGIAAVAWVAVTYAVFTGLTLARHEPPLSQGIDGGWLLAVVGTQSLSVLAALMSPHFAEPQRIMLDFFALSAWLLGGMLYTWLMTLIVYRALFFRMEPHDLRPSWWINMGAMAISALAGAQLVLDAASEPMLQGMVAVLRAGTILCWVTGTWWLPLLVALHVWRHIVRKEPVRYSLAQWSAVFPLGMYSVANEKMFEAFGLGFLATLSAVFFWLAAAAWLAAAFGWVRSLRRTA